MLTPWKILRAEIYREGFTKENETMCLAVEKEC